MDDRQELIMSARLFGERPALCRGLAVVPVPGGLVIDGGPQRQQFTGAAATDALPRLLAVLDGTRTRSDLREELGLHDAHITQMLDLLAERSLLERGDQVAESSALTYLSRTAPINRLYGSAYEASHALAGKRVLIAAPPSVAEHIAADLAGAEVGCPQFLDLDQPFSSACDLVIVYDEGDAVERAAGHFEPLGTPVLRIASYAGSVEIGPRFTDGHTACVSCFRSGYEAATTHEPQASADFDLLSALAAAEALTLFGVGSLTPAHVLRVIDALGLSEERFQVVPEPDCHRCGLPGRDREAPQVFDDYEWDVEARPIEIELPTPAPPSAPNPLFHELDYVTSPRRPVAELAHTGLELLLSRSAGRRPGTRRRWAPTGGNLGSVEMFLLAESDLIGLPGNVFKYDATAGDLIAARADDVPWMRLTADSGLPTAGLHAAFVFFGALWRISPKYGSFALRLAHLDAGCALTQFSLLAQEDGWGVRFASGWTGELAECLELEPRREVITAVAALYRKEPGTDARHH